MVEGIATKQATKQKLIKELERRKGKSSLIQNLRKSLFPAQQAVYDDPSKKIVVDAGRRGGKTSCARSKILKVALESPDDCYIPVVETSSVCMAAKVMWRELCALIKKYDIPAKINNQLREISITGHATIVIVGANQADLAEKFRGATYPLVVIDETGSFRPTILQYLLQESIGPALLDYDGAMMMIGTPGAPFGPFYEACHSSQWSRHHWTAWENPHIPHVDSWVDENILKPNGWARDNPIFRREWLGEWVIDDSHNVYKYDDKRNLIDDIPEQTYRYILGVDLGFNDPCAFVVLAYNLKTNDIFVVECEKKSELIPSALAVEIDKYRQRYKFSAIVADTGGIGKAYVEELRRNYRVPVVSAEKQRKYAYIEFLNDALLTGRLKLLRRGTEDLQEELMLLQWADKYNGKIDDKYDDHLCDALLYGFRYVAVNRLPDYNRPRPGTKAYAEMIDDQIWEEDRMARNSAKTSWWKR